MKNIHSRLVCRQVDGNVSYWMDFELQRFNTYGVGVIIWLAIVLQKF
ncbi:MAG: hypothetical protein M0Q21_12125 [Ignavibacteriaceae bacterium]|nr:hypothetical protein [Ignavibacteriaceae bacterium]